MTDHIAIEGARRARDLLDATLPIEDDPTDPAELRSRALSLLGALQPKRQRFDLSGAIRFAMSKPESRMVGYEGERQQELQHQHAKHLPNDVGSGFFLDGSDLAPLLATRADTVGAGNAGGYLVETEMYPDYIELARARSVIGAFGATFLGDLNGAVTFGRVSGSSISTNWSPTETSAPSDGTQTFSQVSMTPRQVSVTLRESRQLILQTSSSVQAFIAEDVLRAVGQAADVAALNGSGFNGQPLGILNYIPAIGSVSGTNLNNSGAIDLQAATAKRLSPAAGYCAPVATAQLLAKRLRDSTNIAYYVWENGLYNGQIAGCRAIASDDVPASTLIFGNWDQMLVGSWGPIYLEVSPYGLNSSDFQAGTITLRVILLMDIALRDPAAFAAAASVT